MNQRIAAEMNQSQWSDGRRQKVDPVQHWEIFQNRNLCLEEEALMN